MDLSPIHQVWPKHNARYGERGKKTRHAEEGVERQHQGIDRPGVFQVPEGSGDRKKWRKRVVKLSVVPQWPLWLRDRWRWRRESACICVCRGRGVGVHVCQMCLFSDRNREKECMHVYLQWERERACLCVHVCVMLGVHTDTKESISKTLSFQIQKVMCCSLVDCQIM